MLPLTACFLLLLARAANLHAFSRCHRYGPFQRVRCTPLMLDEASNAQEMVSVQSFFPVGTY
eukprot:COSAG01_NODE_4313_length_5140_cov_145.783773_3_plen_62_part_00